MIINNLYYHLLMTDILCNAKEEQRIIKAEVKHKVFALN